MCYHNVENLIVHLIRDEKLSDWNDLSREQQEEVCERYLQQNPIELKRFIEHNPMVFMPLCFSCLNDRMDVDSNLYNKTITDYLLNEFDNKLDNLYYEVYEEIND